MPHQPPGRWPRSDIGTSRVLAFAASFALIVAAWPLEGFASDLRRTPVVEAVEGARSAIVNIHGEKSLPVDAEGTSPADAGRRVNGMGTGVIIDSRGYIVTNHHVVLGVRDIKITLQDGTTHPARLLTHDADTDLALIKYEAREPAPVIRIGRSDDLMPGEPVIAVGNAYGYKHTVTCGIISALHRTVQVSEGLEYRDLIQTDASINPGNSGGPLLNIDGEMIDINVAVRAGAQGIGFAIPTNRAMEAAAELLSSQRLGDTWHGIVLDHDGPDADGVTVKAVEPGSPAEAGGVQPGDRVTTAGDVDVVFAADLERGLLGRKVDEEVEIHIRRGLQDHALSIVLDRVPKQMRRQTDPIWELLGFRLKPISRQQFRRYNSRYRGGLAIVDVRPNSPAAEQGIRRGDVLVGMHEWETVSLDNVAYILNRSDLSDLAPIKFFILRGDDTWYGHMPIAARQMR